MDYWCEMHSNQFSWVWFYWFWDLASFKKWPKFSFKTIDYSPWGQKIELAQLDHANRQTTKLLRSCPLIIMQQNLRLSKLVCWISFNCAACSLLPVFQMATSTGIIPQSLPWLLQPWRCLLPLVVLLLPPLLSLLSWVQLRHRYLSTIYGWGHSKQTSKVCCRLHSWGPCIYCPLFGIPLLFLLYHWSPPLWLKLPVSHLLLLLYSSPSLQPQILARNHRELLYPCSFPWSWGRSLLKWCRAKTLTSGSSCLTMQPCQ